MAELEEDRMEICRWNHRKLPDGEELPSGNFVNGDLRSTWEEVCDRFRHVSDEEGTPALLAACPPCQGMSTARSGLGQGDDLKSGKQDKRNLLVKVIADVADELEPKLIVVENVPAFLTRKVPDPNTEEGVPAARLLCMDLRSEYRPFPFLVDLVDYGVPQHRQRTFITFLRKDLPVLDTLDEQDLYPYPLPQDEQVKLGEFLEQNGDVFPKLDARENPSAKDPMDEVPSWSEHQYRMADRITKPGGSAWDNGCDNPECDEDDVDQELAKCPDCGQTLPRPIVEKEDGEPRLVKGFRRSSYRRMPLNEPAPTVTTASNRMGSNYNIHPTENRLMTPRECARLQGFPPSFQWRDPKTGEHAIDLFGINDVRAMIGEAVPPTFTKRHGEVLLSLLRREVEESKLIAANDERCTQARETLNLDHSE